MVLLENETFLTEMMKFFQKSKTGSKSIRLTMKRYNGETKPKPREGRPALPEPTEHKCLIRIVLANKKISTVVSQKDINKFQMAYANILKASMDGLKKKEKVKAKTKTKTV